MSPLGGQGLDLSHAPYPQYIEGHLAQLVPESEGNNAPPVGQMCALWLVGGVCTVECVWSEMCVCARCMHCGVCVCGEWCAGMRCLLCVMSVW